MKKLYILLIFLGSFIWIPEKYDAAFAERKVPAAEKVVVDKFYNSFAGNDELTFKRAADALRNYYLGTNNTIEYFKAWSNEISYFLNHKYISKALKEAGKMRIEALNKDNRFGIGLSSYALGLCYETNADYPLAKKYYAESIKIFNLLHDKKLIAQPCNRLADLYLDSEPTKADKLLDDAIAGNKDPSFLYDCYSQECMLAMFTDNKAKYKKYYSKCIKLQQGNKDNIDFLIWSEYLNVIHEYFEGSYKEALKSTQQIAEKENMHQMRYYIFKKMNDNSNALKELEKMYEYKDVNRAEKDNEDFMEISKNVITKSNHEKQEMKDKVGRITFASISIILFVTTVSLIYSYHISRRELRKMNKKNEELRIARDKAEESDRMKLEFIENMSHEIRTPLNAISGFSQIIATDGDKLGEKMRMEISHRISMSTRQLIKTIDAMLELSSISSDHSTNHKEDVNCNIFFNLLLDNIRSHVTNRIEVVYESHIKDGKCVHIDKINLRTALDKLLDNACKFTEDGEIRMISEIDDRHSIMNISIINTGHKIPAEKVDTIFHRFVKLNNFIPGAGIGLTVCKYTMNKIGGNVSLDKAYTKGNKFDITLPI